MIQLDTFIKQEQRVRTDSVYDDYWGKRFVGAGHFYGGDG